MAVEVTEYCKKCGQARQEEWKFCPRCGARQEGGGLGFMRALSLLVGAVFAVFLGAMGTCLTIAGTSEPSGGGISLIGILMIVGAALGILGIGRSMRTL